MTFKYKFTRKFESKEELRVALFSALKSGLRPGHAFWIEYGLITEWFPELIFERREKEAIDIAWNHCLEELIESSAPVECNSGWGELGGLQQ
jgi:hypothetical protein